MNAPRQFKRFCYSIDDRGAALTSEIVFLSMIAIVGLVASMSAVRNSVISEFSDVGGSVQDAVQSYAVNGVGGLSATTAGMDFGDATDHCDDPEDVADAADNQITFDTQPRDEKFVSQDSLSTLLLFNGDTSDSSPFGNSNGGVLQNGASIIGGQLVLDGVDDYLSIPNSADINSGGPFPETTIHVEFTPNDVTSRQVVYEEGGGVRGLNIYIDNGLLYFGGYNIPETGYMPTFVSVPITAGVPISATITLNGGPVVTANAFSAYLNGSLVGQTPGSQLFSHGGGIGVGGANGGTVFHDGPGSGGTLNGTIDSVSIYNRTLSEEEVCGL